LFESAHRDPTVEDNRDLVRRRAQFLIGIVHRLLMLCKAKYINLKTASSDGNNDWFLLTLHSVMFKDSIVFVA
jgi:hypothetical protein